MADKMASRISVGLLAAVTLSLSLVPMAQAQYARGSWVRGAADGYAVGGVNGVSPWWNGGGAYGGGYPGTYGSGMMDMSNQLLYPTADGPQPTTTPVPTYQTEMMDAQMTSNPVPHQSGPSMSFSDGNKDLPKASNYFRGFWNDMNQARAVCPPPVAATPATPPQARVASSMLDRDTPTGSSFDHPVVQSHLTDSEFNSHVAEVRSELKPELEDVEQLFMDLKQQNKLGTFDIEPLETQLLDLRRRARQVARIQNSYQQKVEMSKLINDINDFEFQLKQHQ